MRERMREGPDVVTAELGLSLRVATDAIALAGSAAASTGGARNHLLRFQAHTWAADGHFVRLHEVTREFAFRGVKLEGVEWPSAAGCALRRKRPDGYRLVR